MIIVDDSAAQLYEDKNKDGFQENSFDRAVEIFVKFMGLRNERMGKGETAVWNYVADKPLT